MVDFEEWWKIEGQNIEPLWDESDDEYHERLALRAWLACEDINDVEEG